MNPASQPEILQRIQSALEAGCTALGRFTPGAVAAEYKSGRDPVTEADRLVDDVLRQKLLREGEGWLSEESPDDFSRLQKGRVWVVDPLDGTREFVAGIPEFCISAAMVDNGRPVAGGVCNPATNEFFLGCIEFGLTYNGRPAQASRRTNLEGAVVLASRSEVKRGEWRAFQNRGFEMRTMGSIAYKLARVAAGLADATFTLKSKHEWDVAAGAALVESAGGFVATRSNAPLSFNQRDPLLSGLVAGGPLLRNELLALLDTELLSTKSQGSR
jgi:myo-inositol-1(or 4)-monophosphatase